MALERVLKPKPPCTRRIEIDGTSFTCVKKLGHTSQHRIEGPIRFNDPVTGLVIVIDRSIEWTFEV